MRIRRLAVVLPLTGALAVGAAAAPAFAAVRTPARTTKAAPSHGKPTATPAHGKPTVTPVHGKPTQTPPRGRPSAVPSAKKPTGTPFAVTGTLSLVDPVGGTVTVAVKGGKAARGTTVVIGVAATATVNLDDAPSTLSALPVGAHVAVTGTATGTTRTATRINADDGAAAPSPSPSPAGSPSPSPSPAESLSAEPSPSTTDSSGSSA